MYIEWPKISQHNTKDETYMFCISLTCTLRTNLKLSPNVGYKVKSHYIKLKLTIQSPFLGVHF